MNCGIQHGPINVLCSAQYGHKNACVGLSVDFGAIWYNWPGCEHRAEHGRRDSWCSMCGVALFYRDGRHYACDGIPF
jgi:hypothetical protein